MVCIETDCDSFTEEDRPTMNHGTEHYFYVYSISGQDRRPYIKFPISSIPGTINNVTLWIYCYSVSGTQPRTLEIRRVTSSWTETGITWNNVPTTTDTNKVEFVTIGGSKWYGIDITNMFGDETGSDFSVQIKDKNEDGAGGWGASIYYSRDYYDEKPYIEINGYYVKVGGNDGLSGASWANAWATVNRAATTVPDGSTVHIGFGDYISEPTANKIAPQNIGSFGIEYLPETATTGGGTGTVSIEQK